VPQWAIPWTSPAAAGILLLWLALRPGNRIPAAVPVRGGTRGVGGEGRWMVDRVWAY